MFGYLMDDVWLTFEYKYFEYSWNMLDLKCGRSETTFKLYFSWFNKSTHSKIQYINLQQAQCE